MIEPRILSGGATVILEPVAGTRTISLGFWFPFGSRHESADERGFTHFIEHMLFKGSAKRGARDIALTVDRLGGYINAFTEREAVCVYCTLPDNCVETALDVLFEMLFFSSFPQAEFEKEKTVIINEILSAEDDPEDISYDKFLSLIWPNSSLSAKIAGEASEVEEIQRDALYRFYQERFRSDNLLICAAGSMDQDRLLAEIETQLVRVLHQDNASPFKLKIESPRYNKTLAQERSGTQQVQLFVGQPFILENSSRFFHAFSIFNCAFGESMSSRLFQRIREDRGYCYSIFSFFAFADDVGLWCVNGSTTGKLFPQLKSAVSDELELLLREGLSEEEVRDAQSHLKGSQLLASEDMEHRMKRLARQYRTNDRVLTVDEAIAELDSISTREINEMAWRSLTSGEFSVFAFGALKRDKTLVEVKGRGKK